MKKTNTLQKVAMKERKKEKKAKSGPHVGVKSFLEATQQNQYLIRKKGIKVPAQTTGNRK